MSDEAYPFETGDHLSAAALNAALAMGQSNQWRSGAGAPNDATGKDGDMWLDTTTGNVYQRQSGVYVLTASIVGPPGPPGPATPGPPGPPGTPGAGGTVTSVGTSGTGISGGPITVGGVLTVSWNGPAVNALGSGLSAAGGTLVTTPPAASSITGTLTYAQLPAAVQQVPISFPFSGKPSAGAIVNVPMAFAVTVPASLAGAVVYDTTKTTSNATFNVNKIISTGGTSTIGTVVITSTSNTSCTLSGTGGTLNAGDILQIVAPLSQDATLADVGISILASRV